MKNITIPIVLMVLGIALVVFGTSREDSIAGAAETIGTSVANAVDGQARQPDHIWYYIGGGVLIAVGLGGVMRKRSSSG